MDVEGAAAHGIERNQRVARSIGRDVKLILASEDVIHDFSVPAFRVKMDVVPGHYNTMWFRPTKAGRYHSSARNTAATNHSLMGGWVTSWERPTMPPGSLALPRARESGRGGEKLFADKACLTCHLSDGLGRAPSLNGLYGATSSAGRRLDSNCG